MEVYYFKFLIGDIAHLRTSQTFWQRIIPLALTIKENSLLQVEWKQKQWFRRIAKALQLYQNITLSSLSQVFCKVSTVFLKILQNSQQNPPCQRLFWIMFVCDLIIKKVLRNFWQDFFIKHQWKILDHWEREYMET